MNTNQSNRGKKQKNAKELVDDLVEIGFDSLPASIEENEMLSLIPEIASEALKGVDIAKRYQTFYQKLLNNVALREAFIDAIVTLEAEKENAIVPLPDDSQLDLSFLSKKLVQQPIVKHLKKNQWKIEWNQAIDQLQASFFPTLEPTFRNLNSVDDTWVTILKGEMDVEGTVYFVILDCGILDDTNDVLSTFLNIAVTLKPRTSSTQFPIYATLNWGKYSETLTITEEGRVKFPDIPFEIAFAKDYQNIISALNLELVISP